jgi:hypothetical protein
MKTNKTKQIISIVSIFAACLIPLTASAKAPTDIEIGASARESLTVEVFTIEELTTKETITVSIWEPKKEDRLRMTSAASIVEVEEPDQIAFVDINAVEDIDNIMTGKRCSDNEMKCACADDDKDDQTRDASVVIASNKK